jgi:hypothetical protein
MKASVVSILVALSILGLASCVAPPPPPPPPGPPPPYVAPMPPPPPMAGPVVHHCGHGRHYVAGHHHHGHWVHGHCVQNHQPRYDAAGIVACIDGNCSISRYPLPACGERVAEGTARGRARGSALFQRAAPQREHLVPGLLGRQRVVDGALAEGEAVLGAGEHLQLVLDAVLIEQPLRFGQVGGAEPRAIIP